MNRDGFKELQIKCQNFKTHFWLANLTLLRVLALTGCGIVLSLQTNFFIWFLGQLLIGFAVLQWFILIHDFGHNCFFRSKSANWIWGHIASVFVLMPFTPWKYIHAKHHTWTGWQDLDPTTEITLPGKAKAVNRLVAKWSWRLWIPLLSLAFSFKNFWNMPRLFKLFPKWKYRSQFIFSFLLMQICFWVIIPSIPNFLRTWVLGYYIFLVIADPLLVSQHSHVPQNIAGTEKVRPIPVYEQGIFTRSLIFPPWFSNFILLNFNAHEAHHIFPNIPCYYLNRVNLLVDNKNSMNWWKWVKKAKSLPADQLIYSNRRETGWEV